MAVRDQRRKGKGVIEVLDNSEQGASWKIKVLPRCHGFWTHHEQSKWICPFIKKCGTSSYATAYFPEAKTVVKALGLHLCQDPSEKAESWPKIYCNSTENGNICWVGNGDGDPKPKGPPGSHWVPEGDIRELGGVFYWVFWWGFVTLHVTRGWGDSRKFLFGLYTGTIFHTIFLALLFFFGPL